MEMDVERLYGLLAGGERSAVREARGWLLDCFGEPEDQEDIRRLSALQVVQSLETHYEGGYVQFLRDGLNVKGAS